MAFEDVIFRPEPPPVIIPPLIETAPKIDAPKVAEPEPKGQQANRLTAFEGRNPPLETAANTSTQGWQASGAGTVSVADLGPVSRISGDNILAFADPKPTDIKNVDDVNKFITKSLMGQTGFFNPLGDLSLLQDPTKRDAKVTKTLTDLKAQIADQSPQKQEEYFSHALMLLKGLEKDGSSAAIDILSTGRLKVHNELLDAETKLAGTVLAHSTPASTAEISKALLGLDSSKPESIKAIVDLVATKFHNRPEALEATLRAGIDLIKPDLSAKDKALIAKYGAELIAKIPKDQLGSVSDLVSRMVNQNLDLMTIGADSNRLARELGISPTAVAATQRTLVNAVKGVAKAQGIDPASIVDSKGSINIPQIINAINSLATRK